MLAKLFSHTTPHPKGEPMQPNTLLLVAIIFWASLSCLYFLGNNLYGLFDVDEAIFSQATLEMVENSDYVKPTYNAEPRYHKPPLIYWAQATSLRFYEQFQPAATRIPSAIFALFSSLILCFFIAGQTFSIRIALFATGILTLNLSWMVISRAAIADAALNFFIISSTFTLLGAIYSQSKLVWWQILAGLLLGGGLLTKGPVALTVPAFAWLTVLTFKPERWATIKALNPFVIAPVILLVITPWLYFIYQETGLDFFQEFFMVHNVARFTSDLGNTQSSSPLYYLIVLLIGFFPWVILIPSAIVWLFTKGDFWFRLRSPDMEEALPVLGLIWCVATIVLFSFSGTKLPHYIIPGLFGMAILMAYRLDDLADTPLHPINFYLGIVWVLIMAAFFLAFNTVVSQLLFWVDINDPLISAILSQNVMLNWAPYGVGIIMLLLFPLGLRALTQGFRSGVLIIGLGQILSLGLIISGIVPVVHNYTQKPLTDAAMYIKAQPVEYPVYHVSLHYPSVRLISQRPFTRLDHRQDLSNLINTASPAVLLTEEEFIPAITQKLPNRHATQQCYGPYCVLILDKPAQKLDTNPIPQPES